MGGHKDIPRASRECTFALVRSGYPYISSQCDRLGSNLFYARLMLQKTLFMRGEEAAELFYNSDLFTRQNAAPKRLQKTLFGVGGVQGLEGVEHQQRKSLFLPLLSQLRIDELMQYVQHEWQARLPHWQSQPSIVLLDEMHLLLCRAACQWCGIPLHEEDTPALTKRLVLMIEGAAAIGPKYFASRRARHLTENALITIIDEHRQHPDNADRTLLFAKFADAEDTHGELLPSRIVAVELLNVIRPIVAAARYMVFAVMAIHDHPHCREALAPSASGTYRRYFIQEVRRYYPFFPFLAARVKKDFTWHGYDFKEGRLAILDIYGTNHCPYRWENPEQFNPQRFEQEEDDVNQFAMIPQGGSDHATHHRCPGERITLALIDFAVERFTRELDYEIPPQDMAIDLNVMPARPQSGLMMSNVRARPSPSIT